MQEAHSTPTSLVAGAQEEHFQHYSTDIFGRSRLAISGKQKRNISSFSSSFFYFLPLFLNFPSFSSSIWFSGWAARPPPPQKPWPRHCWHLRSFMDKHFNTCQTWCLSTNPLARFTLPRRYSWNHHHSEISEHQPTVNMPSRSLSKIMESSPSPNTCNWLSFLLQISSKDILVQLHCMKMFNQWTACRY